MMDSIDQATHITGRDLKKELLKKSDGVIRNTLSMMEGDWTDDEIIAKLWQDFSSLSTMDRAREELKSLYQDLGKPITVFIYKYSQMQISNLSTGIKAERETHPFAITGFISALEPQLNRVVAKKYMDARNKPHSLQDVFQLAEYFSRKIQQTSSLDQWTTINLSSSVNEISSADINEVSQGHWNSHGSNNYGKYDNKKSLGKQDNYKGKILSDKKPWHNKDWKPWNKDQKS